MLGGWPDVRSGFLETAFAAPRRDARKPIFAIVLPRCCMASALRAVMDRRADLLEHTAQRFLEIARALTMRPKFLLLDEPPAA